jgi:hypothetical protein
VPSRRWQPWQFKVQFCQANCASLTPAGTAGGAAGPAAHNVDIKHSDAADDRTTSAALPRTRALICKILRCTGHAA